MDHLTCPNDADENIRELICTDCGDKFGLHHTDPKKNNGRVCYGIGCECQGFQIPSTLTAMSLAEMLRESLRAYVDHKDKLAKKQKCECLVCKSKK